MSSASTNEGGSSESPATLRLQRGDLLFLDLVSPEAEAIGAVTREQFGDIDAPSLSHVGICANSETVVEAWPHPAPGAVQRVPREAFLARAAAPWGAPRGARGLRFSGTLGALSEDAAGAALRALGRPYDHLFVRDNDDLYCAELIYEAFREANGGDDLFTLSPMHFGAPGSAERCTWATYYEQRGAAVPQGEPGISPLGVYLQARRLGAAPLSPSGAITAS